MSNYLALTVMSDIVSTLILTSIIIIIITTIAINTYLILF